MPRKEAQPHTIQAEVIKGTLSLDLGSLRGEPGKRGLKGLPGKPGEIGPRGLRGLKGETGPQGPKGTKGTKGDMGELGPIGPQGPRGELSKGQKVGLLGVAGLIGLGGLWGLKGNNNEQNIPLTSSTTSTSEVFIPITTLPALDEQSSTTIATEVPVPTTIAINEQGTNNVTEVLSPIFKAEGALSYPDLINPDPSREPVFPDVAKGERPALVAYESPYEDGDYFEDAHGDIDLPQYNYRVMTAGEIKIDQLGIDCKATDETGCLVILINHFGETAMFRDATVDNGFTIAGRVFDMSTPEQVTETGQALLDHYNGRMTESEDGAPCKTIGACKKTEWHVVVVGNGEAQAHWTGIYIRP